MPLSQRPGEAQVDFGHALANFGGTLKKIVFFVMSLAHSDAMFVNLPRSYCSALVRWCWEKNAKPFLKGRKNKKADGTVCICVKRCILDNSLSAHYAVFGHNNCHRLCFIRLPLAPWALPCCYCVALFLVNRTCEGKKRPEKKNWLLKDRLEQLEK